MMLMKALRCGWVPLLSVALGCGSVTAPGGGGGGSGTAGRGGASGTAGQGGGLGGAGTGTAGAGGAGTGMAGAGGSGTGTAGAGGAGRAGAGGSGTAGASGAGGTSPCPPGQVWCPGCTAGSGACSVGGCPGIACPPVDAGCSGSNCPPADGGAAGAGGGAAGSGGAGGATACQAIAKLDRSCTAASDCVAVGHVANCCGTIRVMGLRASEQAKFQQLEPQCDASYPGCGCATGLATTDDGSVVGAGGNAGVTCAQGTCTTFVPACGQPCAGGTTCFSCSNHNAVFAACTATCAASTDCRDPALPLCQLGTSGNVSGMYCTAAGVGCDTK
jgi:hypothetical protein